MKDNAQPEGDQALGDSEEDRSASRGPLDLLFPPDTGVWSEARKIVGDSTSRVERLATAAIQDPIIIMELLRTSNAMYYTGGRAPITSPKTSIVRLGSDVILEMLERLGERTPIKDPDISRYFESFRNRCKRIGIVGRILAEAISRGLADDCQAAGCLMGTGEMLAVLHFGEEYVKLADEHSRNSVNYRLSQNHHFDVDKMGINYLHRYGIPDRLLFAIDRESRSRYPERAILKPLCMAAEELVDAFDANKWEKLAPGKKLAPKSAIRILQISDSQYLKIYERASEYLFSMRMLEERKKQENAPVVADTVEEQSANLSDQEEGLESEIQQMISNTLAGHNVEEEDLQDPPEQEEAGQQTVITELTESLEELEEQFNLNTAKHSPKTVARVSRPIEIVAPPKLRTSGGNQFLESVTSLFDEADSSEELLSNLLQRLVDGPFEKTALIVVSHDRRYAIVVAARGPNIGTGQKIELNDPLSPLAQCFSKVQSFATKANEASPFGCKSFALAPIDADHDTPVALYADPGNNGALSFEARRVFRNVVDVLNQKLPSIPGGIPVELHE